MESRYKAQLNLDLLREWHDFCRGARDFDHFHFSTILMEVFLEGLTPEVDDFLRRFSEHFPNALYENLKRICSDSPSDRDVLPWVKRDLTEKRKILEMSGTNEATATIALIDGENYSFTHDMDRVYAARRCHTHSVIYHEVGDFVGDLYSDNEQLYALVESLYKGVATDYDVAHSIVAPLLKTSINLGHYFEIYLRGGQYILADDHILVYEYRPDDSGSAS